MYKLFILLVVIFFIYACDKSTEPQSNYNPPEDHSISKDGAMHKPGLSDPETNCASCHGSNLLGGEEAPSCYECHGKEW